MSVVFDIKAIEFVGGKM